MKKIKVLIFNNYGGNIIPSEVKNIMNKSIFPKNRTGEVIKYIESHYEPITTINDATQYNVETKTEQSYFCIETVDISRPWKIAEYDGAEYIQYLDIEIIDKELNYYDYKE